MPLPSSKSSSSTKSSYRHDDWIAGHGDVMKHFVLMTVVHELQAVHTTDGILFVDAFCGDGVYDLNQVDNPHSYKHGILKLLQRYEKEINDDSNTNTKTTPVPIRNFIQSLYTITGCSDSTNLDVYPGSPIWIQSLLRIHDEHRLCDKELTEEIPQWLDLSKSSQYENVDAMENIEFLLPYTEEDNSPKHPVIFIDPNYEDDNDYGMVKSLLKILLEQNPFATIVVYWPTIAEHKFRWSFPNQLKDIAKSHAKSGRYFCNIQIGNKEGFVGSGILVCNPTRNLDDVLDDHVIHYLANTMNQGKDEYTVEQFNKKKKKTKAK